jgi:predicted peptidase
MREDNMISSKDKLKETWYRYNKYIILSVCLIIVLVVVFVIFNKKDKGNRYQDIERIMIINAQNYIKNNNISNNYYVSLNNLNIKIDESLKCNNLSGVYKDNDSYYPYLVCQDYKSRKINELIEENDKSKEYGELNGDSLYFVVNDKYQDAGVKTDYQVNVKGNDIGDGLNIVTYYINDNGKNLGELKRIVIGEEVIGNAPVLTLLGEKTRTLPKGSIYSEQGYKAIDEKDGNITANVVVEGNVNTNEAGTYKLVYSVTNSRGKSASIERTIIVNESDNIDLDISHILDPSTVTKKSVTITVKVSGSGYKSIVLPDKSESKNNEVTYTVYKSGTYDFVVYDINNNSEVYSVVVKNIIKDPPSGSCVVVYENDKSTLKVNADYKESIENYEIYNDNKFLTKQKSDSYIFNDYPIETKVKLTDVISQNTTITCKIEDKDPKYFTAGGFKKSYNNMGYWLYVPPKANIHEKLPLIIFLHGAGEVGPDLDNAAKHGLPKYIKNGTMDSLNVKAIIIAPQAYGWSSNHAQVVNLINHIKDEYNIDENKISLFGFSMGANGGMYIVDKYPQLFAAFVPIGASRSDFEGSRVKSVAMRGYSGELDTIGVSCTNNYIRNVKNAGGDATMTVIFSKGHVCTDEVFLKTDVLKWVLNQSR